MLKFWNLCCLVVIVILCLHNVIADGQTEELFKKYPRIKSKLTSEFIDLLNNEVQQEREFPTWPKPGFGEKLHQENALDKLKEVIIKSDENALNKTLHELISNVAPNNPDMRIVLQILEDLYKIMAQRPNFSPWPMAHGKRSHFIPRLGRAFPSDYK